MRGSDFSTRTSDFSTHTSDLSTATSDSSTGGSDSSAATSDLSAGGSDFSAGWGGDTGGVSLDPAIAERLKVNDQGLVPAIVQQYDTNAVLMLAWMDAEALHRTLTTGRGTYWSRSRGEYWVKGETSGHAQRVIEVRLDCDGDTVLVKVDQTGAACHTGAPTCFDNTDSVLLAP